MLAKEGAGTRELADLFSSHTAVRSSPFAMTISKLPRLVGRGRMGMKRERDRARKSFARASSEILCGVTSTY